MARNRSKTNRSALTPREVALGLKEPLGPSTAPQTPIEDSPARDFPPKRKKRRKRSPEELKARQAAKAARLATLEGLGAAMLAPGDPKLQPNSPLLVDPEWKVQGHDLAILPARHNGSELHVSYRYYDGGSRREGEPIPEYHYALLSSWFTLGKQSMRSRGAVVYRHELREVAAALIALADELDAEAAPNDGES